MIASGNDAKKDATKSAPRGRTRSTRNIQYVHLETDGDEKKVTKIMEKFKSYCTPRKNVTWEKHVFNSRSQQPGEKINQYVTDLCSKAKSCEFGTLIESLIRDRIVCSVIINEAGC